MGRDRGLGRRGEMGYWCRGEQHVAGAFRTHHTHMHEKQKNENRNTVEADPRPKILSLTSKKVDVVQKHTRPEPNLPIPFLISNTLKGKSIQKPKQLRLIRRGQSTQPKL